LSQKMKKSISKLVADDYELNGLYQLVVDYKNNISVLNNQIMEDLRVKITDFPVGINGKKKVLIFSPHPDDDVICMAGTMRKMTEQGHEVHVAY